MNTDLRKQLLRLGRQQQNKIWLDRIISRMSPLLWWSASILFLGGIIHQLMSPLDPLTVVWLAILPSLLVISWIIARVKPTADEGAAAADRLFGANSLFVSAWELSRSTTAIEGISRLLLRRTEAELPAWPLHIRKQHQRYMKPSSLAATTLGLVGLFFLLQPPQVRTSETQSTEVPSTTALSQRKPLNQGKDPATVLSELFIKKTVTADIEQHPQQNPPFDSAKGTDSQSPLQNQQAVAAEISEDGSNTTGKTSINTPAKPLSVDEESPPAQKILLTSSSQSKGKKIADRTAGNDAASSSNMVINKAEAFDRVSLIDIETGTDKQTTAFDGTREGEELIVSAPMQSSFRQPAGKYPMKVSQTSAGT
ncbi:MAG: hypothetical protein QNL05_00370, partial [Gammaproteobacteria bacterium]|nr:hypothetical protein [Gammaproteobacteria bacterium]